MPNATFSVNKTIPYLPAPVSRDTLKNGLPTAFFAPSCKPERQALSVLSFYRQGNQGSERFDEFPGSSSHEVGV